MPKLVRASKGYEDVACQRCGRILHVGDYPFCNGTPSGHGLALSLNAQRFRPVVFFRDKKGHIRFPGRDKDPVPKGYERVELTTSRQVQQFERTMSAASKREWESHAEDEHAQFSEYQKQSRSELRAAMQHMSPLGRDFAEFAIKQNDGKPADKFDADFHVRPFHYDGEDRRYREI